MGVKLFKRKKYNQSLNTPSKVGTNNEANTPDTAPGSPIPQEETELPASTPKNAMVMPPIPTSYNKRIMESETPLVSNVASNPQRMAMPPIPTSYNMRSETAPVSNIPQQVKSNQIRNEIGQYYDMRDRGTAREMTTQPTQKVSVTRTFSQPAVGVRAFSTDESEDVELQLTSDHPSFQMRSPVAVSNNAITSQRRSFPRNRSLVPKFVSKLNQDEVSIPSVITDPEGTSVQSLPVVEENTLNETQQEPESTWSKVSLKNKVIDGGQSIDDAIKSLFSSDQKTSAATEAGGIEHLLGILQCNEDTTCAPILQCDTLCGQELKAEKDVVDLENEQEQQFALKFNNVRVLFQRVCLPCCCCYLFYSYQLCRVFVT